MWTLVLLHGAFAHDEVAVAEGVVPESDCSDRRDNDGDQLSDCMDMDCWTDDACKDKWCNLWDGTSPLGDWPEYPGPSYDPGTLDIKNGNRLVGRAYISCAVLPNGEPNLQYPQYRYEDVLITSEFPGIAPNVTGSHDDVTVTFSPSTVQFNTRAAFLDTSSGGISGLDGEVTYLSGPTTLYTIVDVDVFQAADKQESVLFLLPKRWVDLIDSNIDEETQVYVERPLSILGPLNNVRQVHQLQGVCAQRTTFTLDKGENMSIDDFFGQYAAGNMLYAQSTVQRHGVVSQGMDVMGTYPQTQGRSINYNGTEPLNCSHACYVPELCP